jgi:hypothetical protein
MDAFEGLVSEILWREGYWVRKSFKVDLTKEEKVTIGRKPAPRWELDILAFSGRDNVLRVVERKSYPDPRGVIYRGFDRGDDETSDDRYKLFNEPVTRAVVFKRLKQKLSKGEARWCSSNVKIQLCLACGRFASENDERQIRAKFRANRWELWGPDWLRGKIKDMADESYENEVSAVVSKLLLRHKLEKAAEG